MFQVKDVIVPSLNHEALKEAGLTGTASTDDQLIQQLLQGVKLGNGKLSELLREVRRVAGATFGDDAMLR